MRHVSVFGPVAAGLLFSSLAFGADPATQDVALPAHAGTYTFAWTGTAIPGAGQVGTEAGTGCATDPTSDAATFNFTTANGFYDSFSVAATYEISWQIETSAPGDDLPDLALTVLDPDSNATSSDGNTSPEVVETQNTKDGEYQALVCTDIATGPADYQGKLTVTVTAKATASTSTSSVNPNFGKADPESPGVPRFQTFTAPLGIAADGSGGEYSIGYNPKSGAIMNISISFSDPVFSAHVFNAVTPELRTPELPASCDASWVDVSNQFADSPQPVADPILWTDQDTGRTFAADNTTGPNPAAEWAFTDDDGASWTPAGSGLVGADHETVVSGPYPKGSPYEATAIQNGYFYTDAAGAKHGKAVYFCAQNTNLKMQTELAATCARSDDGGLSWTAPQLAVDGGTCNHLHGHLHIAPDGTAYLPIKNCGAPDDFGPQGGSYTTDAGDNWTQFQVPDTTKPVHGSDPSIAIDTDGTLYYCYVNGDGHARIRVGNKTADGLVWGKDTDLGKTHGVVVSAFPEAIGGDSGRAACGFLGTNGVNPENPSDVQGVDTYESLDFSGVWYLYVATTYDGGQTWNVVNATPNDPVQGKGGIWQNGGSHTNRNLLDFNEVTLDAKGRILFGYNDGCIGSCIVDHVGPVDAAHQVSVMTVSRQTGGRSMYARFDDAPETDFADKGSHAPDQPCITGTRDDAAAHLVWRRGDSHGSAVTKYTIAATREDTNETTYFTSTTNSADVPTDKAAKKYTFKVSATSGKGKGKDSLPISLESLGPAPAVQVACEGLGMTVATSPPGATYAEALPTGQDDLLAVYFGEPAGQSNKLVITVKVDNLNPAPPPGGRWMVYFKLPNDTNDYFVAMSTAEGPTPVFNYGTRGATEVSGPAVGSVTSFGTYDTLGTVDGSWNADGTIQFVLDTSKAPFALRAGDVITNIAAAARQVSSPSQTNNVGLTADSAAGSNYTVVKNSCGAPAGKGGDSHGVLLGGSLGFFTLLPLFGAGFLRRRRNN